MNWLQNSKLVLNVCASFTILLSGMDNCLKRGWSFELQVLKSAKGSEQKWSYVPVILLVLLEETPPNHTYWTAQLGTPPLLPVSAGRLFSPSICTGTYKRYYQ